jgi:hypothetical protein
VEITTKTFQEFVADQKDNFSIVVLGAGAPLEEWVNGINGELKESSITDAENCFTRAYTLSDNVLGDKGRCDLVLVFDPDAKPNMGKMALWRVGWNGCIGWTDDFIANHGADYGYASAVDSEEDDTDEEEPETTSKPFVQLSGEDGNVFSIIGRCGKALKNAGQIDKAKEFSAKAMKSDSYDEVLRLAMEYCDVA